MIVEARQATKDGEEVVDFYFWDTEPRTKTEIPLRDAYHISSALRLAKVQVVWTNRKS